METGEGNGMKKSEQEIFYEKGIGPCWTRAKSARFLKVSTRQLSNYRKDGLVPLHYKIEGQIAYPAINIIAWKRRTKPAQLQSLAAISAQAAACL